VGWVDYFLTIFGGSSPRPDLEKIRMPINKVGFILQLGYFRASGKFFENEFFRPADIKFVCNILNISLSNPEFNFKKYSANARYTHKSYILKISGWQKFTKKHYTELYTEFALHAKQQMHPKSLLPVATNYLINRKIELPVYYVLAELITKVYNKVENLLVEIVNKCLSENQKAVLDDLIWIDKKSSKHYKYSALSRAKQFSFSTKIANIQESVKTYKLLKEFYSKFLRVYSKLELSESATSYYSEWVKRAKLFQLKQFPNRAKAYLYLLAHIKHQYFRQTDLYVDILLKLVGRANNIANKKITQHNAIIAREQRLAFETLTAAYKGSEQALRSIVTVLDNQSLNSDTKVDEARYVALTQLESEECKLVQNDKIVSLMEKHSTDQSLKIQLLRGMGSSLQRKLTPIICELDFEAVSGNYNLYRAINNYAFTQGKIDKDDGCDFLGKQEAELVQDKGIVNALAYKAALFSKTYDAIKAGKINLWFSYKYLSMRKYLINDVRWEEHDKAIIDEFGLSLFSCFDDTIK